MSISGVCNGFLISFIVVENQVYTNHQQYIYIYFFFSEIFFMSKLTLGFSWSGTELKQNRLNASISRSSSSISPLSKSISFGANTLSVIQIKMICSNYTGFQTLLLNLTIYVVLVDFTSMYLLKSSKLSPMECFLYLRLPPTFSTSFTDFDSLL